VFAAPGGLISVDVAADLAGSGTERTDVGDQLADLAGLGVEREAVRRERRPELWVGGDCGVSDAVDGLDRVADPDRMQGPPSAGGIDAGVDLEMQMPVRVTGPRGVVPDHRGLDPLHRDLDLPAPRPDPGPGVPGDPADDLGRRPVLGGVQCRRYLRANRVAKPAADSVG
jgi:hypothetical protein